MLGPHFYYDLIRLARNGWLSWLRVVYLGVLLVSLWVMHESQTNTIHSTQIAADQAARAQRHVLTVIIVQDLLLLILLRVYVGSAIVQDKEDHTLETLFLTNVTDREIVVGKFSARLVRLAALVLAGMPLLGFLHVLGNVPVDFLLVAEANTLLLLVCGGAICLHFSTTSEATIRHALRLAANYAASGARSGASLSRLSEKRSPVES